MKEREGGKRKRRKKKGEREKEREKRDRAGGIRGGDRRRTSTRAGRRRTARCAERGKKGDGMVTKFGCQDRDSMGKVSEDLGSPATNQNFEKKIEIHF